MIERPCEVCGAPMILKRPKSSRKYCDACAKKVRMENQKIARAQLKLKRKAEKIRERDKLGSLSRELDTYNNERRKRGECPISYGKYVAIVEVCLMSDKEIKMMRSMRESGATIALIAKAMECSQTTVYNYTKDCKLPEIVDWRTAAIRKLKKMRPPKNPPQKMYPCEHCQWRKNKETSPVCVVCYQEAFKNGI